MASFWGQQLLIIKSIIIDEFYDHNNLIYIFYFSLPGVKKPVTSYGPAGGAPAADDDDDDDDDDDLFGSDDEDTKALREKRLAEYAAKKAKSKLNIKYCLSQFSSLFDVVLWDLICYSGMETGFYWLYYNI